MSGAGDVGSLAAGARLAAAVSSSWRAIVGNEALGVRGGVGRSMACEEDGEEDSDGAGFGPDVRKALPSPSEDVKRLPSPCVAEDVELLSDVANGNSMMAVGGDRSTQMQQHGPGLERGTLHWGRASLARRLRQRGSQPDHTSAMSHRPVELHGSVTTKKMT